VIPQEDPSLVRDRKQLIRGARFWHPVLGVCTAQSAPDRRGRFPASYVQHLADGTPQEVEATDFHIGILTR
jgi:hypothetical protein